MVNIRGKEQASNHKINRSTTHIRVKKPVKFSLERYMRKHCIETHSQAVKKLLEVAEGWDGSRT